MSGHRGFHARSSESREAAVVEDGTYAGPDGGAVDAYLVRPASSDVGHRTGPGVLAWHWFDPKAPDGDRTQFVDEAVELAGEGFVSLLPQGRFPWSGDPSGGAADVAAITAEVGRMRAGIDLLAAHPAVDAHRIGVVGHDFGGMLATIASADDDRVGALVVIAATPRWGDWFLPFWEIPDDRIDYLRALRPLDPIERIGDVPCPVLYQFAGDDFFIAEDVGARVPVRRPRRCRAPDLRWRRSCDAIRGGAGGSSHLPAPPHDAVGLRGRPGRVVDYRQSIVPAAASAVSRMSRSS
jgi:dienelactone hydrolase